MRKARTQANSTPAKGTATKWDALEEATVSHKPNSTADAKTLAAILGELGWRLKCRLQSWPSL